MATKKTTAKKTTTKKPQARKWYILANGEGTRWGNYKGVPKQLIEIEGETLLNRMTRLLKENGVAKKDIIICGPFKDANATNIMTKSKTKREVFEEIAELAQGPFGILYGDCYYTEAIIKELVTRPVKKFDEFFCCGANPNTGCTWEEGYAHRCDDWKWWLETMHELNNSPEIIKAAKDWFIHWWLLGVHDERMNDKPVQTYDADHDIYWCDQTDDFDYPDDLTKFCNATGLKCTNIVEIDDKPRQELLSIIIPSYNSKNSLEKLIDGLVQQKYNHQQPAEIIVIDDGSTDGTAEMLRSKGITIKAIIQENKGVSAARNAGLKESTGKYIAFVDADDKVSATYIKDVLESIKDDSCDFAIFPWNNAQTGEVYFDVFSEIPSAAVWAYAFKWECIKGELFREDWQIGEDLEWLKRVLPGKRKKFSDKIVYTYDWNANPDSLCKQYNRGEIKQERK